MGSSAALDWNCADVVPLRLGESAFGRKATGVLKVAPAFQPQLLLDASHL